MPYSPPPGWVEVLSPLERLNVFHESAECDQVARDAELLRVDRPGRCKQCPGCVRNTVAAALAS